MTIKAELQETYEQPKRPLDELKILTLYKDKDGDIGFLTDEGSWVYFMGGEMWSMPKLDARTLEPFTQLAKGCTITLTS